MVCATSNLKKMYKFWAGGTIKFTLEGVSLFSFYKTVILTKKSLLQPKQDEKHWVFETVSFARLSQNTIFTIKSQRHKEKNFKKRMLCVFVSLWY